MRGILTGLLLVLDLGLAIVEEEELESVFIVMVSSVAHVRNELANLGAPASR
jgi:hypothetical protein